MRRLAAVAAADGVAVRLLLLEQVALARPLEHALAGFLLRQPGELAARPRSSARPAR